MLKIYVLCNPVDSFNDEDKSWVYQIPSENCDVSYIGQTRRNIKTI